MSEAGYSAGYGRRRLFTSHDEAPFHPATGPAFLARTGRTLSGLYPDWGVASGAIVDVIAGHNLAVAIGAPTFEWPTFHREGVYYPAGSRHSITGQHLPGSGSWLAFAEVTCIRDNGANHGGIFGAGSADFSGVNIYTAADGSEAIKARIHALNANNFILSVNVTEMRAQGPILASVVIDRVLNLATLRVSRNGVFVGTQSASIATHNGYTTGASVFGIDQAFPDGGNVLSYAGVEVISGTPSATLQADLHAALGYE